MGSLFLELSKQESLLKMMEEQGFTLCQQNGQRTYGGPPPGWGSRPPPNRDCEVFIGRLPRMCFEDELIPLFASVGELYEFRLMLDFSGTNRGYAYAHYTTSEGAARAIKYLNKFEIRPGHLIGVLKSKNNCRLLFGNIKSAIKVNNFTEFIRTATDQVLNVIMFDSFNELKSTQYRISSEVEEAFLGRVPKQNGKFAIVEYENHKAAAVARRILIPKYGHILAIDWAVPPREKKRFASNYTEMNTESQLKGGMKSDEWNCAVIQSNEVDTKSVVEGIIDRTGTDLSGCSDQAAYDTKSGFLAPMGSNQQSRDLQGSPEGTQLALQQSDFGRVRYLSYYKSSGSVEQPNDNKKMSTCEETSDTVTQLEVNNKMVIQNSPQKNSSDALQPTFDSVPLLVIKPSVMNTVSFMPRIFASTLTFFKHLLKICTNSYVIQLEMPPQIYRDIERKIIDPITNMENCGEGAQLIINYFSWWIDKKPGRVNPEVQLLLQEVKIFSNYFLQYIWNKILSGGQENPEMDNLFCHVLPIKLALLHRIILVCNGQNPFRFVMRISKGLAWLDDLMSCPSNKKCVSNI